MNSLAYSTHSNDVSRAVQVLMPGEFGVSVDDNVIMTILGSCVSIYLCDLELKIGGLNHFLLPDSYGPPAPLGKDTHCTQNYIKDNNNMKAGHYGVGAMGLLINSLLKKGARKEKLVAKVFGGAKVIDSKIDIGATNIAFAFRFLHNENIPIISHCVGGTSALKIYAYSDTGTVLVRKING